MALFDTVISMYVQLEKGRTPLLNMSKPGCIITDSRFFEPFYISAERFCAEGAVCTDHTGRDLPVPLLRNILSEINITGDEYNSLI